MLLVVFSCVTVVFFLKKNHKQLVVVVLKVCSTMCFLSGSPNEPWATFIILVKSKESSFHSMAKKSVKLINDTYTSLWHLLGPQLLS